jgi:hypothetical protein
MAESPAKDKNYNLVTFLQQSLENVWMLGTYIDDADSEGDQELVDLFKQAQGHNQEGADNAKRMLADRLGREGG